MIRFVLRLAGALLAEEICERIRPTGKHTVGFWLDGRWHEHGTGTRYPWQADVMWDASDTALVQAHQKIFSFLDSAEFPRWYVEREGATMHFTSTDDNLLLCADGVWRGPPIKDWWPSGSDETTAAV